MKKIKVIIMVLVMGFTFVLVQPIQQVQAIPIVTKVATLAAKKGVKEFIKKNAVETAIDLYVEQAFKMAAEDAIKYKAQSDYELFCGKKMPDLITCEKPMQVKKVLTDADKVNIGNQAELELDKLITNGKGLTRWQKFLDWFIPIWAVAFVGTALTYALDSEVRSLFNEAGYNALVALGIIKPIIDVQQLEPVTSEPKPVFDYQPADGTAENPEFKQLTLTDTTSPIDINLDGLLIDTENVVMEIFSHAPQTRTNSSFFYRDATNVAREMWSFKPSSNTVSFFASPTGTTSVEKKIAVTKNGTLVYEGQTTTATFTGIPAEHLSSIATKTQSIRTRLPYKFGDYYYTDVLAFTTDGDTFHYQIRLGTHTVPSSITRVYYQGSRTTPSVITETLTVYKNKSPYKKIIVPGYEEVEAEIDLAKDSPYMNDEGEVALVPPSALPYTQTSTGLQLTPVPQPDGETVKFTDPQGNEVPDDDITVGEPEITPGSNGEPSTVTPPASQNQPNPEPIPLVPGTPPPTPPTTGTGTPPEPEDGGGGKPNIPISLLLGLFKLLNAIIFYVIRMAAFVLTIQFIEPTIIPNPYFQWFTTAEILGIQPYPLVKNVALFFLSFSIYKSIRRVFP